MRLRGSEADRASCQCPWCTALSGSLSPAALMPKMEGGWVGAVCDIKRTISVKCICKVKAGATIYHYYYVLVLIYFGVFRSSYRNQKEKERHGEDFNSILQCIPPACVFFFVTLSLFTLLRRMQRFLFVIMKIHINRLTQICYARYDLHSEALCSWTVKACVFLLVYFSLLLSKRTQLNRADGLNTSESLGLLFCLSFSVFFLFFFVFFTRAACYWTTTLMPTHTHTLLHTHTPYLCEDHLNPAIKNLIP